MGVGGQLGQRASQRELAAELAAEGELGLGEAEVRGDHVVVDRLGGVARPVSTSPIVGCASGATSK